jgi:hypothetical protein
MVLRPDYLLALAVVVGLVHFQYRRVATVEERLFGRVKYEPRRQTTSSILFGLLGGALGTGLFILIGISLSDSGVAYIWPLALLLMAIHPRFLCFSYAGGLLSLSHLLFGWPKIHIPSVMGLVAVLHLVESVLIRVSGHLNPNPVYVKGKDGRVVGGFALQKFWPLPLVALVYLTLPQGPLREIVEMPSWWPLIKPPGEVPAGMELVYILFPVVAALGYGDMALSRTPREKAALSSRYLFAYSIILLVLAVLADSFLILQYVSPLFAILGHDLVIQVGNRRELGGKPLFTPALDGLGVLDVFPGGTGHRLGLRQGDVILAVNGQSLLPGDDLRWLPPGPLELLVRREEQEVMMWYPRHQGGPLGVLFVPLPWSPAYVELKGLRPGWLVRRLRSLWAEMAKKMRFRR